MCGCVPDDPATEAAAVVLMRRRTERTTRTAEQELPVAHRRYGDEGRDVTGGGRKPRRNESVDAPLTAASRILVRKVRTVDDAVTKPTNQNTLGSVIT